MAWRQEEMNLDIADTSLFEQKMDIYKQYEKEFSKEGFSRSIATKILKIAWLTVWDAYYLFIYAKKIPRGGTYLEIKSWKGGTLLLVREAAKTARKSISFITIGANVDVKFSQSTKNIPRMKIIQSNSTAAVGEIADKSIDLLFLDGARSYEFVKLDIQNYWPKVKIGGIFLGHDYSEQKVHKGVVRATNEAFGWNVKKLENSRTFLVNKQREDLWTDRTEGGSGTPGLRKYDMIIPYFHGQERTSDCIESIIKNSKNYRIIATADGSKISEIQTVSKALESAEQFTHLINLKNIGFPGNVNRALRTTEAEYVAIVNNDVTVLSTWLEGLKTEYLRRGGNCFLGPSGAAVSPTGGNMSSAKFPQVDYLGWSIIFSSKKCFDRVGLLDESFKIGYYEDVDFGLRAKKLGIKSFVFSPPVSHYGGFSMNKIEPLRLGHARNLNLAYLKKKWNLR